MSAIAGNRQISCDVYHYNQETGGNVTMFGWITNILTANQFGRLNVSSGGVTNNLNLSNYGQGGHQSLNDDIILSDEDYITVLNNGAKAGDVLYLGACFLYLNNLYGIHEAG